MTRPEAIENLRNAWDQREQEFCVGTQECEASAENFKQSMMALGVTSDELCYPLTFEDAK